MKKQNKLWLSARKVLAIVAVLLFTTTVSAQTSQTHIVKRGETFASIASKYGITESELRTANPNAENCYAGTKLNIIKKAPVLERTETATNISQPSTPILSNLPERELNLSRRLIDKKKYKKASKFLNHVLRTDLSTPQQKEEARSLLAEIEKKKEERRERWVEALGNLADGLKETGNSLMAAGAMASQMDAIQRGAYVPPSTPAPVFHNPTPWYGSNTTQQILTNQQRHNNEIARQGIENMNSVVRQYEENSKRIKNQTPADSYYQLAQQGDVAAQNNLGLCYSNGEGVAQNKAEAVKWYNLAAQQGLADAQYNLGVCYSYGEGVAQNMAEAVKWYKLAAQQGFANAQYNLGVCYSNGEGVAQDKAEAVKWYNLAAQQGLADAQYSLGVCYWSGRGVAKNNQIALEWLKKSKGGRLQNELLEKLRDQLIDIIQKDLNGLK